MHIKVSLKKVVVGLICLILVLLIANVVGIISRLYFDHDYVYGLVPMFNFDTEQNFPTFYSSFTLLLAGFLLSVVALAKKSLGAQYFPWAGLAAIFLFLSIDESIAIHEGLGPLIRGSNSASGFLYFVWVVPYGAAVVVFVLAYLKFLMNLPRKTAKLFVVAGTTFVTGALGFEMLEGRHVDLYGSNDLAYSLLYTGEEMLEMIGIVIFVYAILEYMVREFDFLAVSVGEQR